jgi:glutamate N-acetyltransferase/amino-acid N-acetyltransferase
MKTSVQDFINIVKGGVCAPKGFRAAGICCGIKKKGQLDLALIASDSPCAAAAVYTKNQVKAAPVQLSMKHLENGRAQAVIVNSGNANACAVNGNRNALRMTELTARGLGIATEDVVVGSTGVIGVELDIARVEKGMPELIGSLTYQGSQEVATAIMTTDTFIKELAVEFSADGKSWRVGGIAKGSGMVHPNMGTTLTFVTTDMPISPELLDQALRYCVDRSLNQVSVDGDTSTNDMAVVLANGQGGGAAPAGPEDPAYLAFREALLTVLIHLARELARDGEGASRLLTCQVSGAASDHSAAVISKAVVSSTLTKAAMFGSDANWGRILCAMGYSGEQFDYETVAVSFRSSGGELTVCQNGRGVNFDEKTARQVLSQPEVDILIEMTAGDGKATAWGCDLTYDYVKINGDYRS